jgi:hypothetical protein
MIMEESDVKVSDMLADNMDTGNNGKLGDAQTALREYLEQSGESLKKEVVAWMHKEGYPQRTVERAATKLKVIATTTGYAKDRRTTWRMPEVSDVPQINTK